MDFEELQVIWNSQNHEKMYAINENVLHTYIKQKGKSINNLLNFFEFMLIGMNLAVGIWLTIESLDNNPLLKPIHSGGFLSCLRCLRIDTSSLAAQ